MSCPTGIRPNADLKALFAKCKDGQHRLIKISIQNEELVVGSVQRKGGELEQDLGGYMPKLVEANEPCYFLILLDTGSRVGQEWLLVAYSPDSAPIRAKMLLAATRATLKQEFGPAYIRDEWHISAQHEASLDGYKRHVRVKAMPGPMTDLEAELHSVRVEEGEAKKAAMQRSMLPSQTLRGVAFPIDGDAEDQLRELRDGHINYVQLAVDTLNEAIKLEKTGKLSVEELRKSIPRNAPRYHFYAFDHIYDDRPCKSIVFMYSIPSGGCTIKERMLFSSCKGPFLETVERFIGLHIDRKVEMDANEAVTEEWLMDEVHPKLSGGVVKSSFARPKGPPGRGLPRITRPLQ